ncbi:MAG: ferrous iron transport protein B [Candidatus Hydrothermarchaeales archaeon]
MHQHKKTDITGRKIVLVGNPNVGKSVISGLLTGRYVTVSNYPGTTVEITHGNASFDKESVIVDTPGINNLIPMSEDERVTRDILLTEDLYNIIQVADSKNLRRGLLITLQLAEMGLPFVLDLNMHDEAKSRGITIDTERLSEILGIEAIATVATQKEGLSNLIKGVSKPRVSNYVIAYDEDIERGVREIAALLPEARISRRSIALMLLAGDESLGKWLHDNLAPGDIKRIERTRQDIQFKYTESLGYAINRHRLKKADEVVEQVVQTTKIEHPSLSDALGRLSTHPVWGVPILLLVLYLTYKFVGEFGAQTLVDFMERRVFGGYINPWSVRAVNYLIPAGIVRDFLVGEYGMVTMALSYGFAIILPIVGTFFIVFGILEDSGYLPRLAVMLNKVFRLMGLNGKAVLPMVLGLGCDTMATMTTRTLDTRKDRIIVTLLLALAVPCSAQLGVVLGMLGMLSFKATALWAGVVGGVLVLVGFLASKVIPGESSDFVLELPPIRMPQLSNIIVKTMARVEWYLKEVIPLFILGTTILFVFDKLLLLQLIEELASPLVVNFLGLPAKATEAFLIGFLRRDFGAAGLFTLARAGQLDAIQTVVSLVTITLFVPCIANFLVIIKERGLKTALAITAFIFPFAFLVGGILNFLLHLFEVSL